MIDLTGFQRDLLTVVAGLDSPKGLAVKENLDDYYDSNIYAGRLYPNLNILVEKGLVEKSSVDDRTNAYTVTKRGEREIEARLVWENDYI